MDSFTNREDPFRHLTDIYSHRYESNEIGFAFGYRTESLFHQIRNGYDDDPMDNWWDSFDDKGGFDYHDQFIWSITPEIYRKGPPKSSTYIPSVHLAYKYMCIQKAVREDICA